MHLTSSHTLKKLIDLKDTKYSRIRARFSKIALSFTLNHEISIEDPYHKSNESLPEEDLHTKSYTSKRVSPLTSFLSVMERLDVDCVVDDKTKADCDDSCCCSGGIGKNKCIPITVITSNCK